MKGIHKQILNLVNRVEALERQADNLIRVGNVKRVEGRKAVIDFGRGGDNEYVSPLIPWVPSYAGDVLTWRAPTIGEQMIVLNLSGGKDEAQAVALSPMYQNGDEPDSTDPNIMYTRFNDVFRVSTDSEGNHRLEASKTVTFVTPEFNLQAADSVNVTTTNYNRTASAATTQGMHSQKGKVDITGALDVSAGIKTLSVTSYAPGAFALGNNGATMISCSVAGKKVETHTHNDKDGDPTSTPI
ncbi:phage baseplate assembly protein V [Vibrio sp. S9_S30]|uniref:phage baseplate assembly protein V n=1 Tax=Vibrio sp. S9_S30 TaxID=2720226 RepID=UPI001680F214|nr:phage baseplate assembly protein V [Vibrio sp. S9_S30]MBD1559601.1 phage baseplate assembly protein V [Vibrio sp. S9_S30]